MKAFNQCFLFIKLLMRVIDCMVNLLSFEKWSKKVKVFLLHFKENMLYLNMWLALEEFEC
ncbi:hypothetical protein CBG01_03785 [Limosilactobacillus reuteri]|uniref:Uncharacterized protein n=1 Tax=Limosilactobacillus reuteri TaxID=1598 RepID=A0A073JL09_LIMRT|nr:hypothetical protein LR3_02515 [Limosilactobacillus reuteri]MRH08828.1 hypothetical protein [Limosilactobacillus reuteri]NDO58096.1 hypothetical protein [Limosilactobacillus reuteri]OYS60172.1 hypothetical protein CBF88_03920 [Limosilactobacillus reuteri]OYS61737.1 hypothetical protein CBF91_04375 [Limosilactobacillus reuteri]